MHEAATNDENSFLTLTYDDEHLPPYATLDKTHHQKFLKRLRKQNQGKTIRFFHAGEYGGKTDRPHYHTILFGHDFADKKQLATRGEHTVYRSETLEKLWPQGNSEIGSVTFESCAYVARYIMKKTLGNEQTKKQRYEKFDPTTGEIIRLEPEYATMSRRPGIGRSWLTKYKEETYRADSVIMRGREMKPPKYYDVQMDLDNPEQMLEIKTERQKHRKRKDNTEERLLVRQQVTTAKLNNQKREL